MATSEEFKRQFRAGNFVEALKLALAEAAELKVTTWVAPTTSTHPQLQTQPTPGHRLLTRMNLLEGDINNEVGTAFLNDGPYSDSELWQFHLNQVESGQQTVHGNLQGLRELFATLTRDSQGQFSPADMGLIDPIVESDDLDAYDSESQLFRQIAADRHQQALPPSIWEPSPLNGGSEAGYDPQITTGWLPGADHQPMPQPLMPQPTIVQPPMPIVPPPPIIPSQPNVSPGLDLDLLPDVIIPTPSVLNLTPNSPDATYPGIILPTIDQQPALQPLMFDEELPADDRDSFSPPQTPLPADSWDDQSALTNGLGNVQPDLPQPSLPGENLAWADVTPPPVNPYPPIEQPGLHDPDSYEPGVRDPEDLYEPDVYYPRLPSANGGGDRSASSAGNLSLRLLLMGMIFKLFKGKLPTAQERADLKVAGAALVGDITHGRTTGESLAAGAAIIAAGAFLLWGVDRMGIVDVPFIDGGGDSSPSTIAPSTPPTIAPATPPTSQTTPPAPQPPSPQPGTASPTPVSGLTTPVTPKAEFIDVSANHWAYPFIAAMAERKFVTGNPEGAFEPDKRITRAEFAALIGKPLNQPPRRNSIAYKDVKKDYWAVQVIDEATRTDFMRGYPKQQFRPETTITRLEVLVTLVSGLNLKPSTSPAATLKVYKDYKKIPKWAVGAIAAATEAGLVVNYPDRAVLNPQKPATRAEATAMMHQALVQLGKIKPVTSDYIINK